MDRRDGLGNEDGPGNEDEPGQRIGNENDREHALSRRVATETDGQNEGTDGRTGWTRTGTMRREMKDLKERKAGTLRPSTVFPMCPVQ